MKRTRDEGRETRDERRGTSLLLAAVTLALASSLTAQTPVSDAVRQYVAVDTPVVALTHAKVIDGTGAPAANDQTIVISGGKIQAVGLATTVRVPAGARVMDLTGRTVIPGMIGLHDHTFYLTYGVE